MIQIFAYWLEYPYPSPESAFTAYAPHYASLESDYTNKQILRRELTKKGGSNWCLTALLPWLENEKNPSLEF